MVPAQTLTQEETPPALLGRVSSTALSLVTVSQLLAIAIAGRLAEWFGIRNLYYGVAVALMLIGATTFVYVRATGLARVSAGQAEP